MGVMAVMSRTEGHTLTTWDPAEKAEVARVEEEFDRLVREGHLAYTVTPEKNEQIRKFDATAEKIVVTPQLVGG